MSKEKKESASSFDELAQALDIDPTEAKAERSDEHSGLKVALEAAEEKAKEADNKFLRLQAEMANFSRRMDRELEKARQFALERFMKELLAVLDSSDQGLKAAETNVDNLDAMREGMALTHKMLWTTLEKFHIKEVNPVNQAYDPHHHEAIAMIPAGERQPNTVVEVVQKGYLLHDRLLRPARVVVAKE